MKKYFIGVAIGLLFPLFAFAQTVTFQNNLYYGLTNNSDVRALQQFLSSWGDYSGPITGNYFSLTRQAVTKFQQVNNITPASGYFGPLTRAKVNVMLIPGSDAATTLQGGVSVQQMNNTPVPALQNNTSTQPSNTDANSATTFQMKAECATLGQQKEQAEQQGLVGGTIMLLNDKYGYSPALKTCVFAGIWILPNPTDHNKDLIWGTYFDLMTGDKISEPGGTFATLMGSSSDAVSSAQSFWFVYGALTYGQ